jgi:hypothetical protein
MIAQVVRNCIHKSPPLDSVLSQMNPHPAILHVFTNLFYSCFAILSGIEECCLLGVWRRVVWQSLPTCLRNALPLAAGAKSKPSKQQTETNIVISHRFSLFPPVASSVYKIYFWTLQFWLSLIFEVRTYISLGSVVSWGTMLQAGGSRVWFPRKSLDLLIYLILPAALWPWGRLTL